MLLERASRFILELSCDRKQASLFMNAMELLAEVVKNTEDLSLLTDGERSYSKYLFQICYDLVRTGKPGRPRRVLPKNLQVKLKNKGSQSHKKGPKKPKYQTPKPEHPDSKQSLDDKRYSCQSLRRTKCNATT